MPEIIGRFAKTHPNVELYIVCEPSVDLAERMAQGELDIALVTHNPRERMSDVVRTEPLCWVGSANHPLRDDAPVPLAVGRRDCQWRQLACSALDAVGREYQILFTSWSCTVVAAAVLAGMAVSVMPESALRTGHEGAEPGGRLPALPPVQIGIMKRPGVSLSLMNAITAHITACLDNITPAVVDDNLEPDVKNAYGRLQPPPQGRQRRTELVGAHAATGERKAVRITRFHSSRMRLAKASSLTTARRIERPSRWLNR